ncbi:hypothetical protein L486_00622 [Kwoniella mangroviensis CBS 10435]|uniref:Uncharacterized protein n=1 Tax=Kwoniella mangroviensis CBS 10435 TaxID=1331196 RepID=A0A1B9IZM3_9TREE|nr:uncharacterized protein I203_04153 [Kwoniella mangroviensis CBS 8507]OCF60978.1 hypothetical protein L486_00622 [Kwoniella mangroviensis CBS 10435]OCF66577.1 hypothetical protein I203_04153 [Kwoniella mangroviensis CBS 8507]OCF74274.1 hypothetical protein I204_04644 [Kwoniella mangroviensis CBS 8886]
MGKQHDDTNVASYKAQNDGHELSSSHVPSNAQGRDVPAQAQHSGHVADHQHDLKKAQNALHEGLKPKDEEGNRVESGAQNANT